MRNPVMNAISAMKPVLTIGVTASPFFKVRNLIRDSVQAIGTENLSYNPAKNIVQGWALTDPKNDAYFRLLAGGGAIHFGTMYEGSEAKGVQSLVESGVAAATILNDEHKVLSGPNSRHWCPMRWRRRCGSGDWFCRPNGHNHA